MNKIQIINTKTSPNTVKQSNRRIPVLLMKTRPAMKKSTIVKTENIIVIQQVKLAFPLDSTIFHNGIMTGIKRILIAVNIPIAFILLINTITDALHEIMWVEHNNEALTFLLSV